MIGSPDGFVVAGEGKDDLGWPYVHLIAKSGLGQRDPATV